MEYYCKFLVSFLLCGIFLCNCTNKQLRTFALAMKKADKQIEEQRRRTRAMFEAARKREPKGIFDSPTPSPSCTGSAVLFTQKALIQRGAHGVHIIGTPSYYSRNGNHHHLVLQLKDYRSDTYQKKTYHAASLHGDCNAWNVTFRQSTPWQRRSRTAAALNRQMVQGARKTWTILIHSIHALPLKANGTCWDPGWCPRRHRNRLLRIIQREINERAKSRASSILQDRLVKYFGLTTMQAYIGVKIAGELLKHLMKPDLYAKISLQRPRFYPRMIGSNALVGHSLRSIKRIRSIGVAKNRFNWHARYWVNNLIVTEGHVLHFDVWDKDLRDDDYVGSAKIALLSSLATGRKVCVEGGGQVHAICFSMWSR